MRTFIEKTEIESVCYDAGSVVPEMCPDKSYGSSSPVEIETRLEEGYNTVQVVKFPEGLSADDEFTIEDLERIIKKAKSAKSALDGRVVF